MHIILLASEDRSATQIARTLFCSRTTVYAVVGRFIREGQAAFDDRKRRGPAPLVKDSARKLLEELTEAALPTAEAALPTAEAALPTERGWLRSRWSCKLLALELLKERALMVSRETVRRVLSTTSTCAGGDPVRSRLRKTLTKSEKGSKGSWRCCAENGPSSRTRPS